MKLKFKMSPNSTVTIVPRQEGRDQDLYNLVSNSSQLRRQFKNRFVFFAEAMMNTTTTTPTSTTKPEEETFTTLFTSAIIDPSEEDSSEIFLLNSSSSTNSNGSYHDKFDAPEYAVFAAVLLCSTAIGIFYACFRKNLQVSAISATDEYLIGNGQVSTISAAGSILCSFISAITILGFPVEIYLYGSTFGLIILSFIPMTLSLYYFYIPVFYTLQLSSIYQYFELRFSRSLRVVISFIGIVYYIIYMSVVVYGPSLAIGQVTGISTSLSTGVIFVVCIFYSTLGGLKGVIATDCFQAILMIGSLVIIVGKGIVDTGGLELIFSINEKFQRTEFLNFSLDPRIRYTVWAAVIGGYWQWLPNFAASHAQVQRYLSMSDMSCIRRALILNLIGFCGMFGLLYLAGLTLFAKYHGCDPMQTGAVTKSDQILPLFVMDVLGDYPGLPGIFVGGVTCASLSSISSGLNSLSAVVTYDYFKRWLPELEDSNLLKISKSLCVLFGLLAYGLVFVVQNMGNIFPVITSLQGIVTGPTLGILTLGMCFPWANSKGSLLGLMSACIIMTTLTVGNQLAAHENLLPDQRFPGLGTDQCYKVFPVVVNDTEEDVFSQLKSNNVSEMTDEQAFPRSEALYYNVSGHNFEELESEFLLDLFSISYMWYPGLGFGLAAMFGLIFSMLLAKCEKNRKKVNPDHLSPPVLWLLLALVPKHAEKWIDLENHPTLTVNSSTSVTLSLRSADFSFTKESICDLTLKRLSEHQSTRPQSRTPSPASVEGKVVEKTLPSETINKSSKPCSGNELIC